MRASKDERPGWRNIVAVHPSRPASGGHLRVTGMELGTLLHLRYAPLAPLHSASLIARTASSICGSLARSVSILRIE